MTKTIDIPRRRAFPSAVVSVIKCCKRRRAITAISNNLDNPASDKQAENMVDLNSD